MLLFLHGTQNIFLQNLNASAKVKIFPIDFSLSYDFRRLCL